MAEERGVRFYPLDFTYRVINDRPTLMIYSKTTEGKKICLIDDSFLSSFYVVPTGDTEELSLKINRIAIEDGSVVHKVLETQILDKKFLGRSIKVIKVTVNVPQATSKIAKILSDWDLVEDLIEHDVSFVRKYILTKNLTPMCLTEAVVEPYNLHMKVPVFKVHSITQVSDDTIANLNVLGIDVEVYLPESGVIDPKENPIIMLGVYGNNFHRVITWKRFETDHKFIEFVDSESDVINRFVEIIEQVKPDFLVGYNSAEFDLPYLHTRAKKYKTKLEVGLDYSELIVDKKKSKARIKGIVHIDSLLILRRLLGQFMSIYDYRLDNIARVLLNENKLPLNLRAVSSAWDHPSSELLRFCESSLNDARLAFNVFESLVNSLQELVKITCSQPYSVSRMTLANLSEAYLIKEHNLNGELIPKKPSLSIIRERRSEIADTSAVQLSVKGLHANLSLFDLRGMLTNLIPEKNISIDTINCECCQGKSVDPGIDSWFCDKKKGTIPRAIEVLADRMRRIESLVKHDNPVLESREKVLRVLHYSFTKYLLSPGARWFSMGVYDSFRKYAAMAIKDLLGVFRNLGLEICFVDEDCVIVKGITADKILKVAEITSIDPPKYVRKALFIDRGSSNPMIALLMSNSQIQTRLFPYRPNLSLVARESQKRAIEIILTRDKVELLNYVTHLFTSIRKRVIENEKFLIQTTLQKSLDKYDSNRPYVAAAKKLRNLGRDITPGVSVQYLIADGEGSISDRVKLPEEAKKGDYDPEYYIGNQILPLLRPIFDAININLQEYITDEGQSRLDGFIVPK